MSTGDGRAAVTLGTQALVAKTYECIQNDVEKFVTERETCLKKGIEKVANDMAVLKEGMKAMQSYIEHMHRQNPYGKKKVEELEERLKRKEEETEQLKNQLKELQEHHDEKIAILDKFKEEIEEERGKVAGAASGTKRSEKDADGASGGGGGKNKSGDKNFEFQEKVEGEHVIIGSELAVVSTGGPLSFMEPLQSNDPNSMLNKDATLSMGPGTGSDSIPPGVVLPDSDAKLIGCDKVNVKTSIQQVFLGGTSTDNIEVDDNVDSIKYGQASQDGLADFLEKAREDADDEEVVVLNADETLQQKDVILRVAALLQKEENVEHFIRLCEYLHRLTEKQLRSLAPDLKHITRIDLSNVQINYNLLSAFFRCFKTKRFLWLLLRGSRINATDMRLLAKSLGSCKIGFLDFGSCSFEYMAFFELAAVLIHVDTVILRSITSAQIVPENDLGKIKPFSVEEARHLADSISTSPKMIGVDLSNCDFRDPALTDALSRCLHKVPNLTLQYSIFTEESVNAMFGKMEKMQKLDFSSAVLRNPGIRAISAYVSRINCLLLSNVLLDQEGVQPLVEALENLPEKGMDVLDISFNPVGVENVSKILRSVGKVKVIIFSREQISYEIHNTGVSDEVLLSEVSGGTIHRLTDSVPGNFTHWIACSKPVEQADQRRIIEAITMSPEEEKARARSEYRCSKCKTHIAFAKDEVQVPCKSLFNDKKWWGVTENPNFTNVSNVVSCIPSNGRAKKHSCSNPGCPIMRFNMRGCKCANCKQAIGGYYASKDNSLKFWTLYQESPDTRDVGTAKNCKQM